IISGLLIEWNMPDIPAPAQPGMFAPRPQFQMPPSLLIMISVIGLVNLLIVYPLTDAAMIHAIASRYLERPIGVAGAFSRAIRIILPLIGTWILMMLAIAAPIAVGTIAGVVLGPAGFLLLLPGAIFAFIFTFWFGLSSRVVVIEGVAGTTALARSKKL